MFKYCGDAWAENTNYLKWQPETHTKRQATRHGCLAFPACWAMGDKGIATVYGEEKILCTGPTRAAKAEQKSVYTGKEGPISLVLFEFQQSAGATHL